MTTKEEILQNCIVEGNVIKLPNVKLDRKLYLEVAKSLELIGGKWKGNKIMGFVFSEDPTDLLEQIANGEKRNLKKEFQFFATPHDLARKLVILAYLERFNSHSRILEPSAGQGSIINEIFMEQSFIKQVDCCEIMPINITFLQKIEGCLIIANDFLTLPDAFNNYYDRVIANPPFSKNQDIDHIRKMYDVCKPGGIIVTIASKHWQISQNKKETEFKNWLKEINAEIYEIEPGSFKDSGTMISSLIIIINKK